ncbi:MAG: hypothetical protein C7B43_03530 [Sulfobacillus benefaciens]|uniref:Uncharacterized protein n=1 Tax=Sulfobacillus benefaciens TaxID=453960 RepID=A0A2T2X9L5_9FIRM|nr:MAG: hypothetical protein C7B43_03530 [Sulfobacillus benefaciens]HBQ93681.1 hypothetical protein [Sulfobacillus sp.]
MVAIRTGGDGSGEDQQTDSAEFWSYEPGMKGLPNHPNSLELFPALFNRVYECEQVVEDKSVCTLLSEHQN